LSISSFSICPQLCSLLTCANPQCWRPFLFLWWQMDLDESRERRQPRHRLGRTPRDHNAIHIRSQPTNLQPHPRRGASAGSQEGSGCVCAHLIEPPHLFFSPLPSPFSLLFLPIPFLPFFFTFYSVRLLLSLSHTPK